jgi:PAS domain S-box-containing protein
MLQVKSLESETGFRVLFECATIGILVVGESGTIELANPCAEKLFGYASAELIGESIEVLIPEALRNRHVDHRNEYFQKPKDRPMGYGLNLFARKKNGTEFPVEISLGHYRLDDAELAVAFVTDITARKANEEKYRDLFENSLAATFITELPSKKIVDVNEMGVRLFGYESKKDFLENYDPARHYLDIDEREKTYKAISGESNENVTEREMKRLDGTHFWARVYVKMNGEKNRAQAVVVDISESKQTHEDRGRSSKAYIGINPISWARERTKRIKIPVRFNGFS